MRERKQPALPMRARVYAHALASKGGRGKLGNTHSRNESENLDREI